jgi:hypothetical protein
MLRALTPTVFRTLGYRCDGGALHGGDFYAVDAAGGRTFRHPRTDGGHPSRGWSLRTVYVPAAIAFGLHVELESGCCIRAAAGFGGPLEIESPDGWRGLFPQKDSPGVGLHPVELFKAGVAIGLRITRVG